MSPTVFRSLIAISISAGLLAGALDLLVPSLIPQDALLAITEAEAAAPMALLVACLIIAMLVLVASIASIVGLLLFMPWARKLAVATTLASLLFWPFLGATVYSGWSNALWEISFISWGAVLAASFCEPLATHFRVQGANNSSKPTPLRGAA